MKLEAKKLLWDALQAAERIARFTRGRSFDEYAADDMLRSAVERQFEIVGEALGALRKSHATTADAIAELPRIVAFRNLLIHGYANIDNKLVWGVVEGDLPHLLATLKRLLAGSP